jgi:PKD repeat protein
VQLANLSLNNPTEYKWSFPGAEVDSSIIFQPTVLYPDTGVYDIQLIATNNQGSDTLLLNDYITVLPLPEINATVVPDSVCRGEQALLQASGGIEYFWAAAPGFPAVYTDSISVSPSNSTTYSVTGLSALGCIDTSSVRLTIIPPPAIPTINNQDTILVASAATDYQWFVNGNVIEGANSILHVPLVNGNYNVRVYNSFGCNSISNPVNVNWVGINKIILSDLINAYPVPADGVLNISTTKTIQSYDIYDSTGRLVISANPQASEFKVNTSSFANGIYEMLIFSETEYGSLKFMVSH